MGKVITEFKVVETEDGIRIEIKGDKEKMKAWMPGMGRRWRGRPGPGGRRRRHGHGPFAFSFGSGDWTMGGPCWDWSKWGVEFTEDDEVKSA